MSDERNVIFAAEIGFRLAFCRSLLTKSPLRSNGVCGMAHKCQLGVVALRLICDV